MLIPHATQLLTYVLGVRSIKSGEHLWRVAESCRRGSKLLEAGLGLVMVVYIRAVAMPKTEAVSIISVAAYFNAMATSP